jgi:hypothetical protein
MAIDVIRKPIDAVVGAISSFFNFDMPSSLVPVTRTLSRLLPNRPHGDGLFDGVTLALSQAVPTRVVPQIGITPVDEMDIAAYASVPGLLDRFIMTTSNVAGDVLASYPVNPKFMVQRFTCSQPGFSSYAVPGYYPTALNRATMPFSYWRGTMRYRFVVIASAYHAARLRIVFNPDPNDSAANFNDLYSRIIEIQGQTEFTVSVPFLHPRAYASNSIGNLNVQVESPFAEIGDVASVPVTVMVYHAGADDLMVAAPRRHYLIPYSNLGLTNFVTFTGLGVPRDDFKMPFDPISSTVSSVKFDSPHFADMVTHFSQVGRRLEMWVRPGVPALFANPTRLYVLPTSLQFATTGAPLAVTGVPDSEAVSAVPTSGSLGIAGVPLGPIQSTYPCRPTLVDHLANMYKFVRGGMRLSFLFDGTAKTYFRVSLTDARTDDNLVLDGLAPSDNWPANTENIEAWTNAYPDATGGAIGDTTSLQSLEVEVPYNSPRLFMSTGDPRRVVNASVGAVSPSVFSGDNSLSVVMDTGVANPVSVMAVACVHRALADDTRFHFNKGSKPAVLVINDYVFRQYNESSVSLY